MPRYIDANKIKLTGLTFTDVNNEVYYSLSDVRKAIEQTPTEDVVEVVRCKDCKYWGGSTFGYICHAWSGMTMKHCTKPNEYCVRGERKVTAESAVLALQEAAKKFNGAPPDAFLGLQIGETMDMGDK